MLVEASVLTTMIIIAVAVVLVLVVELYRRTRFKAGKSVTDSSNKES
jgi:cell division protein FtsN